MTWWKSAIRRVFISLPISLKNFSASVFSASWLENQQGWSVVWRSHSPTWYSTGVSYSLVRRWWGHRRTKGNTSIDWPFSGARRERVDEPCPMLKNSELRRWSQKWRAVTYSARWSVGREFFLQSSVDFSVQQVLCISERWNQSLRSGISDVITSAACFFKLASTW